MHQAELGHWEVPAGSSKWCSCGAAAPAEHAVLGIASARWASSRDVYLPVGKQQGCLPVCPAGVQVARWTLAVPAGSECTNWLAVVAEAAVEPVQAVCSRVSGEQSGCTVLDLVWVMVGVLYLAWHCFTVRGSVYM